MKGNQSPKNATQKLPDSQLDQDLSVTKLKKVDNIFKAKQKISEETGKRFKVEKGRSTTNDEG